MIASYRLFRLDVLPLMGYALLLLIVVGVWLLGGIHRRRGLPVPTIGWRTRKVSTCLLQGFLLPVAVLLAVFCMQDLPLLVFGVFMVLALALGWATRRQHKARVGSALGLAIGACGAVLGLTWFGLVANEGRIMAKGPLDIVKARMIVKALGQYHDEHGQMPPDLRTLVNTGHAMPYELLSLRSDYDPNVTTQPYEGPVDYGYVPLGSNAPADLVMLWAKKPFDEKCGKTCVVRANGAVERLDWPQAASEIARSYDWLRNSQANWRASSGPAQ